MKTIPLTRGKFALVDDADFEAVNQFKWTLRHIGRKKYAGRYRLIEEGFPSLTFVYLHQFLTPNAKKVDHRDGDGLNNQRCNLREASARQNSQGFRLKRADATSTYRGVNWNASKNKWIAQGKTAEGKGVFLGSFLSEKRAALAYDAHARTVYGEFACPNFP